MLFTIKTLKKESDKLRFNERLLQKLLQSFKHVMLMHFANFAALSSKRWSLLSYALKLSCSGDFLWPGKFDKSDNVPILHVSDLSLETLPPS